MASLNKALIIGNLGADPEVRYTQSNTALATFNIATTEKYRDANGEMKENTEWHRIVAWGRLAELAQQYLRKGSPVYIEGSIQTRQWEDKEGQKRYTTEIKATSMQLLGSRQDAGMDMPMSASSAPKSASVASSTNKPAVVVNDEFNDMDDDLPF
jgi:single-strand DNA-binding protein